MTEKTGTQSETIQRLERQMTTAIRSLAAEIMRTVAGGGRSNEIPQLAVSFMDAYCDYVDHQGLGVSMLEMRAMLDPDQTPSGLLQERCEEAKECTFQRAAIQRRMALCRAERAIHKGALRQVASTLLDQTTQVANGRSQMLDGIKYLERVEQDCFFPLGNADKVSP